MRWLFLDRLDFNSDTDQSALVELREVEIPVSEYKQRDLWFRLEKSAGAYPTFTLDVKAYQTRAIAKSASPAASAVVAEKTGISTAAGEFTVNLDDGPESPDYSGDPIIVRLFTTTDATAWSQVYGYTSQVGHYAVENVIDILKKYTGTTWDDTAQSYDSGLALEDVHQERMYKHIGPDVYPATDTPAITCHAGETQERVGSAGGFLHLAVPLRIRVLTWNADDLENAYRVCRSLQERVCSVLSDEQRTLKGMVQDLEFSGLNEPRSVDASESGFQVEAEIEYMASFANELWPDRAYPRSA